MRSAFSSVLSLALAATVSALPTVSVKGSKFFTSDGNQFFVKGEWLSQSTDSKYDLLTNRKGIAYQLVPEDPLIDNTQCQLDASLMKTLGANAIRVSFMLQFQYLVHSAD